MRRVLLLAALAIVSSACTGTDGAPQAEQTTTTPPSTLTAPELQPPAQSNGPGVPDVVFDPCTYLSDDVVREAGFDPSTRRRDDFLAESTMLVCQFKDTSKESLLTMNSTNYPFEDRVGYYTHFHAEDMVDPQVDVNGRRAIQYRLRGFDACYVLVETKVGSLFVGVSRPPKVGDPCTNIVELAKVIEPSIGEGN